MLILNLRGGLGNQIIQIARAEVLDKKFKINIAATPLNPLLNDYRYRVVNIKLIDRVGMGLRYIKSKVKGMRSDYCAFGIMDGYFQAGLELSDFNEELLRGLAVKLNSEAASDLVIHFRGGDYLDEVNKKIFRYIGGEFYQAALARLARDIDFSTLKISVITNDVDEAKRLFLGTLGMTVKISSSSEIEDFSAILNSKYAIVPNSTFSLMARVLAVHANIDCKTVCPRHWFTEQSQMRGPLIKEFEMV